jgi:hypothetical protein
MIVKMAYVGKRHKINTCYIHHEREDMPTHNTEHTGPTREIGQISRCPSGPPTTVEGTYSEVEETT